LEGKYIGGEKMKHEDFSQRTKEFALRIIKLVSSLPRTREANVIGYQIMKSGTSIGANYREAKRARSQADFVSKIGVCEQESDETIYWLELLSESGIVPAMRLKGLIDEASQLLAIFITSSKTAKRRSQI
jgi:four helix bundle protein